MRADLSLGVSVSMRKGADRSQMAHIGQNASWMQFYRLEKPGAVYSIPTTYPPLVRTERIDRIVK